MKTITQDDIDTYIEPRLKRSGACLLFTGPVNSGGYGIFPPREGYSTQVHRVVWEYMVGPIPEGGYICHKCDVPNCIELDHLYLGSALTNRRDAIARRHLKQWKKPKRRPMKGKPRGTMGYFVRLKPEQVLHIYEQRNGPRGTMFRLAREFCVSHQTIMRIFTGATWKHLTQQG